MRAEPNSLSKRTANMIVELAAYSASDLTAMPATVGISSREFVAVLEGARPLSLDELASMCEWLNIPVSKAAAIVRNELTVPMAVEMATHSLSGGYDTPEIPGSTRRADGT